MNRYQCWCPMNNRLPNQVIEAETSFAARQEYARRHRQQVSECVARRQNDVSERRTA